MRNTHSSRQATVIRQSNFSPTSLSQTKLCVILRSSPPPLLVNLIQRLCRRWKPGQHHASPYGRTASQKRRRASRHITKIVKWKNGYRALPVSSTRAGMSSAPSSHHHRDFALSLRHLLSPPPPSRKKKTFVELRRKGPCVTMSSRPGSTPISGPSVSKSANYSLHTHAT